MFDGAFLTVLIGPGMPAPPPIQVTEAIESVQVTSSTHGRSGFQLTFTLGKASILTNALLPAGYFEPIVTRVIILVTFRGIPTVLMDGIITRQEVTPSNQPGQSKLTVTGEDLSVLMDLVALQMPYPAMPDFAVVGAILAKYAMFGIVPVVVPPVPDSADMPTSRSNVQTCTDFEHLRALAQNAGYVFVVQPGPAPYQSIAYFGPDLPIPALQPALSVNLDAHTNVDSMNISMDGLAKKVFVFSIFDPATRRVSIPIPVPGYNPTHPPLGARPQVPAKIEFPAGLSGLTPTEAAKRAFGLLSSCKDAITIKGSLDVLRYGHVLLPRIPVGVRGAGPAFDGLYYVNDVTHSLKRGEYKQTFDLSRDGIGPMAPMVMA
jgi:hypothetical protein